MPRKRNLLDEFLAQEAKKDKQRWSKGKASHNRSKLAGEMNLTEQAYAKWLAERRLLGEVIAFKFEAFGLRLADKSWYRPDFLVQMMDCSLEFHEVKACDAQGNILKEDDADVKWKVAAESFPMFTFRMMGHLRSGGWKEVVYGDRL